VPAAGTDPSGALDAVNEPTIEARMVPMPAVPPRPDAAAKPAPEAATVEEAAPAPGPAPVADAEAVLAPDAPADAVEGSADAAVVEAAGDGADEGSVAAGGPVPDGAGAPEGGGAPAGPEAVEAAPGSGHDGVRVEHGDPVSGMLATAMRRPGGGRVADALRADPPELRAAGRAADEPPDGAAADEEAAPTARPRRAARGEASESGD
jgi:hypothetical protein